MSLANWRRILLAAGFLAFAPHASAQLVLPPVDEAASRPSFFTFRAHLQAAIARHDVAAVLAVLDENIRNSFGPGGGIGQFVQKWKPAERGSALWQELGAVLALGGTFEGEARFIAPYVYSRWPAHVDAFENVAITGAHVRIRAAPGYDAAVVGSLSFAIVPLLQNESRREGWTAIRSPYGGRAYVSSEYVRSSVGYRAIFQRTGDRWALTAFVAGD